MVTAAHPKGPLLLLLPCATWWGSRQAEATATAVTRASPLRFGSARPRLCCAMSCRPRRSRASLMRRRYARFCLCVAPEERFEEARLRLYREAARTSFDEPFVAAMQHVQRRARHDLPQRAWLRYWTQQCTHLFSCLKSVDSPHLSLLVGAFCWTGCRACGYAAHALDQAFSAIVQPTHPRAVAMTGFIRRLGPSNTRAFTHPHTSPLLTGCSARGPRGPCAGAACERAEHHTAGWDCGAAGAGRGACHSRPFPAAGGLPLARVRARAPRREGALIRCVCVVGVERIADAGVC